MVFGSRFAPVYGHLDSNNYWQTTGPHRVNLQIVSAIRSGINGKLWATFLPAQLGEDPGSNPRGISLAMRDVQTVAIYDSKGEFVGIRRPESGKPIVVRYCYRKLFLELEHIYKRCVCRVGMILVQASIASSTYQALIFELDFLCHANTALTWKDRLYEKFKLLDSLWAADFIENSSRNQVSSCQGRPNLDSQETKQLAMQVDNLELTITDLIGSTGLELKVDPGIPYVYLGFGGTLCKNFIWN